LKNFIQRVAFGFIYLVIIIGSLFMGRFAFGLVFLLINLVALYEFYSLSRATGAYPPVIPSLITGGAAFILTFLVSADITGPGFLLLIVPFIILIFILALYSDKPDVMRNTAISFMGIVYVSIPLCMLNFLAFPYGNPYGYTYRIILGILTLVWINDTGAYLVGISIGRHRLFERISPKKSWEGAIGGAVLTIICALWLHLIMGALDRTDWVILALIVSVFGVFGDLTESLFKRSVGQKDSGKIIPGHGGLLDRIDSILFVMPLAAVYLFLSNLK
jgi:phosphatidate cytidylyltransferase